VTQTFHYVSASSTTVVTVLTDLDFKYGATTKQLKEIERHCGHGPLVTQFQYTGPTSPIIDANGNAILYGYDARDNRILERDSLGNTVTERSMPQSGLTQTRYTTPDPTG